MAILRRDAFLRQSAADRPLGVAEDIAMGALVPGIDEFQVHHRGELVIDWWIGTPRRSSLEHGSTVRAVIDPFGEDLVDPVSTPRVGCLAILSGLSLASLPARDGLAWSPPLDPPVGLSLKQSRSINVVRQRSAAVLHRPADCQAPCGNT